MTNIVSMKTIVAFVEKNYVDRNHLNVQQRTYVVVCFVKDKEIHVNFYFISIQLKKNKHKKQYRKISEI
jgi:hypothetical protein